MLNVWLKKYSKALKPVLLDPDTGIRSKTSPDTSLQLLLARGGALYISCSSITSTASSSSFSRDIIHDSSTSQNLGISTLSHIFPNCCLIIPISVG